MKKSQLKLLIKEIVKEATGPKRFYVSYSVLGLEQIEPSTHSTPQEALQAAKEFIESYNTSKSKQAGEKFVKLNNGYALQHVGGGTVAIAIVKPIKIKSTIRETGGNIHDPTKKEMFDYLKSLYGNEEEFSDNVEVAIYWFSNFYHGGQSSNLYSVLSTSPFYPGPLAKGPEKGSMEEMMYEDLVLKFGGGEEQVKIKRKRNALNESISQKTQGIIEKWIAAEGIRGAAYKMINSMVSNRTGMDIRDMADTATLASGIDTVEEALNKGDFEGALKLAFESAKEFFDEEAGGGIFEGDSENQKERDDLINQISDDYKSLHGFRPRHINFPEMSIDKLKGIAKILSADLEREYEQEKSDETQHQAAIQKAKTPPQWNIGSITKFKSEEEPEIDWEREKTRINKGTLKEVEQSIYKDRQGGKDVYWMDNRDSGGKIHIKPEAIAKMVKRGHRIVDLNSDDPKQSELEESGKLKALAAAGLIGYAGLHSPFGQQALAKAGQTPIGQRMSQVMKPVPFANPNEPLPSEKNMNAWDLANKYTARNADVEKKTAPFVKKYLPPPISNVREGELKQDSTFDVKSERVDRLILYGLVVRFERKGYKPIKGIQGHETADKIILGKSLPPIPGSKGNIEYIFLEITNKKIIVGIAKHLIKYRVSFECSKELAMKYPDKIIDRILSYSKAPKQDTTVQESNETDEDALYVEYVSQRKGEKPFMLHGEKFEYVNGKYPSGKTDVAVYAFRGDLVYGYNAFKKKYNLT